MTHLWLRHEHREDEARAPLTPEGVAALVAQGFRLTVEDCPRRVFPATDYVAAGATLAAPGSWPGAPVEAIILGLKELPESDAPLIHRHIFFGHAFKGQPGAAALLARFRAGGGTLYDLEALVDETGRRVAAFGYWAGYAGAAVTLLALTAQARGGIMGPVSRWFDRQAMRDTMALALEGVPAAKALVIGAQGRVGTGAADLCSEVGIAVTRWDMAETAHGGPFPEVAAHDLLFNCIVAQPGAPVFAPPELLSARRRLRVIGDIACDPGVPYSPVPLYDHATSWDAPVIRVHAHPVLDIMAIDNLPSLLPLESSRDFAAQLLPHLQRLARNGAESGIWSRAGAVFQRHLAAG